MRQLEEWSLRQKGTDYKCKQMTTRYCSRRKSQLTAIILVLERLSIQHTTSPSRS